MNNKIKVFNFYKNMNELDNIFHMLNAMENQSESLKKKRMELLRKVQSVRSKQMMLIASVASIKLNTTWCRTKERTQNFWEIDCRRFDAETFVSNFRMSRRSFRKLCLLLKSLKREDTNMRKAIPLTKRIAVALYTLGSTVEYRAIGDMFGIGKSTVCQIILKFCTAVCKELWPIYMNKLPFTREKVKQSVKEFELLGLPQCLGAVGGCHIQIQPATEDAVELYNSKGYYSIVLLALVDAKFLHVNVVAPGRCNDFHSIYEISLLKQHIHNNTELQEMEKEINGIHVPVYIIGDTTFMLTTSLMKPFSIIDEPSNEEKNFNDQLAKTQRVVNDAFAHVKARFRRISQTVNNKQHRAQLIVETCCVLHNFLNENNEEINENWLNAVQEMVQDCEYSEQAEVAVDEDPKAKEIRNAIASYLVAGSVDEDA